MKNIWKDLLRGAVLGFALPAVILTVAWMMPHRQTATADSKPPSATAPTESTTVPIQQETTVPEPMIPTIAVLTKAGIVEMELESYVVGVVLSEMPGSFSMEALKAQSVASRTFALRVCRDGRHDGAVCMDYGCCQGYRSSEEYLAQGGDQESLDRIIAAVDATAGQVLTFEGSVICATYFSCSGGSTEDALAVWGSDVPYLQAVESPGEEFAEVFSHQKKFTFEEFENLLCVSLPEDPTTWFGQVAFTDGAGVDTMEIGGVCYRGTTLRTLLGLRSTAFSVTVTEEAIIVDTLGFGHRVGMSQYGAEAMALAGRGYMEILAHYYQGVRLQTYGPNG